MGGVLAASAVHRRDGWRIGDGVTTAWRIISGMIS